MNIPAPVIAWVALAVSIIAGILSFNAGRSGDQGMVQKQVADLVAKVEAVKPFDAGPLQQEITDLGARLEAVKPFDAAPLQEKITDLSARLEAVKPFDPAPLEAKLGEIEKKLDAMPTPATFDPAPIQARIDELGRKISAIAEPKPFDPAPLQKQVEELGQKLTAVEQVDPAALQARIDDIAARIAALKPFDPEPIQKQLDALAAAMASKQGEAGAAPIGKQRLLGQIYFATNSSALSDESRATLDGWVKELSGKPHRLAILGFSDRVGRAEYNVTLSIRRASAVRTYLLRGGLDEGSLVVSAGGYGEEGAPVATDDGVDEPQNRAVHVYVYE